MSQITGTLENWYVEDTLGNEYLLHGYLYGGLRNRWENGSPVRTSGVSEDKHPMADLKEGDIVETRNSTYLLGAAREWDQ